MCLCLLLKPARSVKIGRRKLRVSVSFWEYTWLIHFFCFNFFFILEVQNLLQIKSKMDGQLLEIRKNINETTTGDWNDNFSISIMLFFPFAFVDGVCFYDLVELANLSGDNVMWAVSALILCKCYWPYIFFMQDKTSFPVDSRHLLIKIKQQFIELVRLH